MFLPDVSQSASTLQDTTDEIPLQATPDHAHPVLSQCRPRTSSPFCQCLCLFVLFQSRGEHSNLGRWCRGQQERTSQGPAKPHTSSWERNKRTWTQRRTETWLSDDHWTFLCRTGQFPGSKRVFPAFPHTSNLQKKIH